MKAFLALLFFSVTLICAYSQNNVPTAIYEDFKNAAKHNYNSFRDECNQKYADFLRTAWDWYQGKAPLPIPKEKNHVPPRSYEPIDDNPIAVEPNPVKPIEPKPQPKPISPIKENPNPEEIPFPVSFYGTTSEIRLPEVAKSKKEISAPIL